MKTIKYIIICLLVIIASHCLYAQVKVEASIANQQLDESSIIFDIYLKTVIGTSGPLFLDNADFVFDFNHQNFTNAVLSKEPNPNPPEPIPGFQIQNGYCTFVSTDFTESNTIQAQNGVQKSYFDRTAVSIVNNQLIISMNGPAPTDQTAFDENVARIDGQMQAHRLGRFRVSGISNPSGNMNLQWVGGNTGLRTRVFSLANVAPFISTEVVFGSDLTLINPDDIALPITLISFKAWPQKKYIQLDWETEADDNSGYKTELERSVDAIHFSSILNIPVNGKDIFTYDDHDVVANRDYYYRLKLHSPDGSFKYSEIRAARIRGNSSFNFRLSPNPFSDRTSAVIENPGTSEMVLEVADFSGNIIQRITFLNEGGYIEKQMDFSKVIAGIYVVRLISGNSIISKKALCIK